MQRIDSYESNSGKLHKTAHACWLDDLDHWLLNVGIENTGVRSQVSSAIVADLRNGNHFVTIVEGVKDTMPEIVAKFGDET